MSSGKNLMFFSQDRCTSMTTVLLTPCYLHSALQCIVHRNDSHIHPILEHMCRYLDMGWDGNSLWSLQLKLVAGKAQR